MPIRRIRSKWAKTDALLASPELKNFVPDTRKFNRLTVQQMLEEFGMIYVKPIKGTFGRGVIRVAYDSSLPRPYRFQSGERIFTFDRYHEMYEKLLQIKRKRPYLTQQGIELLRERDRRFDFRIMVQQNPAGQWQSTGIIGRLAHPRKIVTNYHSGGTPMPFDSLMKTHAAVAGIDPDEYQDQLRTLGVQVAETLDQRFPGLKEIGIDVAIDTSLKPWILEVNTLPDPYLFRRLPDPRIFRQIHEYAVAYGRFRKTSKSIKRRR